MPRVNPLGEAFNAGELSPWFETRLSFDRYPLAAQTLENFLPLTEGPIERRPGTRFVAAVKDQARKPRLLPFEFSTEQAYIVEAGEGYMRFIRNQGQIVAADTDAAITNGDFTANIGGWSDRSTGTASIAHDAANGRLNLVGNGTDVAWAEQSVATAKTGQAHVLKFRVLGAAGDAVQLRIGTMATGNELVDDVAFQVGFHCFAFTPDASPFYVQFRDTVGKTLQVDDVSLIDDSAVEIDTPYTEAQLPTLKRAQSADVMHLVCRGVAPHKLTRSGHTSWSLIETAFQDGPWLPVNATATTLAASAATGLGLTITASATEGINDGRGFLATDVGRLVRMQSGGNWGWAVITGVTSATVVTADQKGANGLPTVANSDWRLGAWSATTGFPCAVTFFEQRLSFAGTDHQPQTFWLSQSADFQNMAPDDGAGTVEDDDALDFTISADQVNVIQWLSGGQNLAIGTTGGEWVVRSTGPILTPTDVDVKLQTTHGSAPVEPVRVGHAVLLLQRAARKVREFVFNFEVNSFRAPDLAILARHITKGRLTDLAWQQEPQSVVWAVRGDGVACAMTYRREENIVAWSRHTLGGSFAGGGAVVETVAVIPGNDDPGQVLDSSDRDEVWFAVKRTINGQTKRYIEFMERSFEGGDADADAFYVDSGLTYDGAPTTTLSGLDHLEGETVAILADGAVHPPRTVSSGAVTLERTVSKAQAGLPYAHTYKSLKLAVGAAAGTALGQIKRVHGVTLVLLDSMNARIGPEAANVEKIPFREVADPMDQAVPFFTGEKYREFDGDYDLDSRIVVTGSDPTPFTLLALAPRITVNER